MGAYFEDGVALQALQHLGVIRPPSAANPSVDPTLVRRRACRKKFRGARGEGDGWAINPSLFDTLVLL